VQVVVAYFDDVGQGDETLDIRPRPRR
jgi:hypothetical protein